MTKINRLLPILAALLLCFPVLTVQAAPWQKNQQAPTVELSLLDGTLTRVSEDNSLKGTVTILLKEINSMEATLKVIEKPEGASASFDTIHVVYSDLGAQGMTKDDKLFLSSSGAPMDVTLQIPMTFTAEGTYVLELDGGVTDAEGFYENLADDPDEYICRVEIVADAGDGEGSSNQPADDSQWGGDFSYDMEIDWNINIETEELEEVIEKVAEAIQSDEQLQMMQELLDKMNRGLSILESGDQESVDQVTKELEESLKEIEAGKEEALKEDPDPNLKTETETIEVEASEEEILEEKSGQFPMILIPILMIPAGAAAGAGIWYRKKFKKKAPDYDGAPMVEYDIEDDDEE